MTVKIHLSLLIELPTDVQQMGPRCAKIFTCVSPQDYSEEAGHWVVKGLAFISVCCKNIIIFWAHYTIKKIGNHMFKIHITN